MTKKLTAALKDYPFITLKNENWHGEPLDDLIPIAIYSLVKGPRVYVVLIATDHKGILISRTYREKEVDGVTEWKRSTATIGSRVAEKHLLDNGLTRLG